jgi:hypothetical protein
MASTAPDATVNATSSTSRTCSPVVFTSASMLFAPDRRRPNHIQRPPPSVTGWVRRPGLRRTDITTRSPPGRPDHHRHPARRRVMGRGGHRPGVRAAKTSRFAAYGVDVDGRRGGAPPQPPKDRRPRHLGDDPALPTPRPAVPDERREAALSPLVVSAAPMRAQRPTGRASIGWTPHDILITSANSEPDYHHACYCACFGPYSKDNGIRSGGTMSGSTLLASLLFATVVHPVYPVNPVVAQQEISPVPTVHVSTTKPSVRVSAAKPSVPVSAAKPSVAASTARPATLVVVVVKGWSQASLWCRHGGPPPINRPPCPCGMMSSHQNQT